jgi:dsDNA-specific endonuclease/ATPase MutS2
MRHKDSDCDRYDFHGKTVEQFEQAIDRLSIKGGVVQIVTGHGRGILNEKLYDLIPVYHFKILLVADNDASFTVDFSN